MQTPTPSPRVSFQLLLEDINAFGRQLKGAGAFPQNVLPVVLILLPIVLVTAFTLLTRRPTLSRVVTPLSGGIKDSLLFSYGLPLVLFGLFWFFISRSRASASTKIPILRYASQVTLNQDAFSIAFGATTIAVLWEGIENVVVTPNHIFIYTQPADGYIVPRRAFESEAEFAQFGDFARHLWLEAKPGSPPVARAEGT